MNKDKLAKAAEKLAKMPDFTPPREARDGNIYTLHKPSGVYHRADIG